MLGALSQAIDSRPYMGGHGKRVTALAEAIALRLGWGRSRIAALRIGGALHDVGKLAVADEILRKSGRLTDDELAEIRRHPIAGVRLIRRLDGFERAFPYVLFHHERWDGGGYPMGKEREQIPLEARVLAVADAFDAMTSERAYRRPLSTDAALDEVVRCAGTQFDPLVARLFVDAFERGVARAAVG